MKRTTKMILALVLLAALIVGALALYNAYMPTGVEGGKHLTVEVIHSDGSEKSFAIATDSENLRGALEQSCNTYFIELGRLLGAQRSRQMAETLGFGTATQLAPGLQGASGTLPDAAALENPGELATFSFGQGALTVTPLQITAMMNTVANGGVYRTPAFVQGIVDAEGTLTGQTRAADTRTVFDAATARVLRSMLASVVSEGIGSEAQPKTGTAGGKTGTAQTGQYDENGEELLNYWFSGFYPADDPRYTITVLQDGILKPETSSAAIFAKVTEILAVWENS